MEAPSFFKPEDLDAHVSTGKLNKLFGLLKTKYQDDADPAGRAKLDIARLLTTAFEKAGSHYENIKASSLKTLMKLQVEALEFYNHAISGKGEIDVRKLENILKEMNKEFKKLARTAVEMAEHEELQPLEKETIIDPKTGKTTLKLGGGYEKGGATYASGPNLQTEGEVAIEGYHPGREKDPLPTPEGMVPGEHKGHAGPEGGVKDPRVTNVLENLASEAARSNLGPKKILDNLLSKIGSAMGDHLVTLKFIRHNNPGEARPYATTYEIKIDGISMYKVTIANK
jgi:hypothetical protein